MDIKSFFQFIGVIIFSLLVFSFFHLNETFADTDSFYHAKMAVLTSSQGMVKNFEWATHSLLNETYADQSILYHFALIPFVRFFDPLVGTKVAAIVFATGAIIAFYVLLKSLKISYPLFFTAVLLLPTGFLYRLNLAKAQSLSLMALFIFLYMLFQKKYNALFFVSFIFVWLHGSFVLLPAFGLLFAILYKAPKAFFSPVTGVLAGIIVNPYFPKNLFFYWQQIFEVAIKNYRQVIEVGGEWYGYTFRDFIASANISFILFCAVLIFACMHYKRINKKAIFLVCITVLFFILSLRSRRHIEYFVPFAVLASAYIVTLLKKKISFVNYCKRQKIIFPFIIVFVLVLPLFVIRGYGIVKNNFDNGFSFSYLKDASDWLEQNSDDGALVFTTNWDETAILFYHNSHNQYLNMLDPTFMYNYDQQLYDKWTHLTTAQQPSNIHSIIQQDFRAQYVLVDIEKNADFNALLREDSLFEYVYEDAEAAIYKL